MIMSDILKIVLEDEQSFGESLVERYNNERNLNEDFQSICVYAKHSVIKNILEVLISEGMKLGELVNLSTYPYTNYEKEFCLCIDEFGVTVEEIYHEDNEYHKASYFKNETTVLFVHKDCDIEIYSSCQADTTYEFSFEYEKV